MVLANSRSDPPTKRYSGATSLRLYFAYRASTFFGLSFQTILLATAMIYCSPITLLENLQRFGLFRVHSPLLAKSFSCFLLLQVLRCFSSPRCAPCGSVFFKYRGFPIRTSVHLRLFAPPHSFSQLTTSFVISESQGIPRTPLFTSYALSLVVLLPTH
jgi:hypothetical protein